MGVHFVLGSRIDAGTLNATEPEALIYETAAERCLSPGRGGIHHSRRRLANPDSTREHRHPALEGHLMNFVDAPNRYGLPAFLRIACLGLGAQPRR